WCTAARPRTCPSRTSVILRMCSASASTCSRRRCRWNSAATSIRSWATNPRKSAAARPRRKNGASGASRKIARSAPRKRNEILLTPSPRRRFPAWGAAPDNARCFFGEDPGYSARVETWPARLTPLQRWSAYAGLWLLTCSIFGTQLYLAGYVTPWARAVATEAVYWLSWWLLAPAIFWWCRRLRGASPAWRVVGLAA